LVASLMAFLPAALTSVFAFPVWLRLVMMLGSASALI